MKTVFIPPLQSLARSTCMSLCARSTSGWVVKNSYTMVWSPAREIIHSLKLVDYLHVQDDKPFYKHRGESKVQEVSCFTVRTNEVDK